MALETGSSRDITEKDWRGSLLEGTYVAHWAPWPKYRRGIKALDTSSFLFTTVTFRMHPGEMKGKLRDVKDPCAKTRLE